MSPRTRATPPQRSSPRATPGAAVATAVAAAALGLTGCATLTDAGGPLDPALAEQIPGAWTAAAGTSVDGAAATGWLDDFRSPLLSGLVREAADKNYDLAQAAARVDQAGARAAIAGADRLPQFDADLNASRSQNLRGAEFQSVRANQFNTGLSLAWEIDLWGRLNDLRRASLAELDATTADYQAARLSLAANVAKTALDAAEAKLQVDLSRMTAESLRTNLSILDRQLELGAAGENAALEISLSRADVARAEASVALNQRSLDAAKRRLEVLLGRYPDSTINSLEEFPALPRDVPAGLPSELLLRRPDLVAAERRVEAAFRDRSAARKALLPSARITGSAGRSSTDQVDDLLDPNRLVWNIAGGLAQPVFQGGRLTANVRLSDAALRELAAAYSGTALQALSEVETSLAAERFFKEQQGQLAEAVTESTRAESLALSQFDKGLVDIITVLESQRRAFDSRSSLLAVQNQRLQNRIDLYLALGGDFDHPPR